MRNFKYEKKVRKMTLEQLLNEIIKLKCKKYEGKASEYERAMYNNDCKEKAFALNTELLVRKNKIDKMLKHNSKLFNRFKAQYYRDLTEVTEFREVLEWSEEMLPVIRRCLKCLQ